MGFWKRQKSKILIGGALLTIATGALGILKREEIRLTREIVGCERVIDRETRDGGVPEEPERRQALQEAVQKRETLQAQQEETKISEEEIQKLIKKINGIDESLRIIGKELIFRRTTEESPKFSTYTDNSSELEYYLSVFNSFTEEEVEHYFKFFNTALALPPRIKEALSKTKYPDFLKEYLGGIIGDITNRGLLSQDRGDTYSYQNLLIASYRTILLKYTKWLEDIKERIEEYSKLLELSGKLANIVTSEEMRERLKPQTAKMQEANEKIVVAIEDAEKSRDYIQNKIDKLKKEAKKKGIQF